MCTSLRTSGPTTLQHWPRKHRSLYLLRQTKKSHSPHHVLLLQRHHGEHPNQLHHCVVWWNASCHKSLQRIVRAAERIIGVSLLSLQDIYSTRLTRKALRIAGDPPDTQLLLLALLFQQTVKILLHYSNTSSFCFNWFVLQLPCALCRLISF